MALPILYNRVPKCRTERDIQVDDLLMVLLWGDILEIGSSLFRMANTFKEHISRICYPIKEYSTADFLKNTETKRNLFNSIIQHIIMQARDSKNSFKT